VIVTRVRSNPALLAAFLSLATLPACDSKESDATTTFYERRISPILTTSCANSPTQSGCHVAADDRGNALGNLNVESYDKLKKRSDLLISYGPYALPALRVKVRPPFQVQLSSGA